MRLSNRLGVLITRIVAAGLVLFPAASAFSKMVPQFVPSLSITEKYTDNYHQTRSNTKDEFTTIYNAGFSFGAMDRKNQLFFNYHPSYIDHLQRDENDSWNHTVQLNGQTWTSRQTRFFFSEQFTRSLDRTVTTNTFEKHDTNTASVGMVHNFGPKDSVGVNYRYSFDAYDNVNANEHTEHQPSVSLAYWFSPRFGINLDGSYEKTDYDFSNNDPKTWSGSVRLLKSMSRHLDAYVAYAHTDTEQNSGDHTIYNPSVGFDWQPTEDSGIRLGIGVLFQEWDQANASDSTDLFLDLDAYKDFEIDRRTHLSITGASGYTPSSDDAAGLGFEIYYQAGALLQRQLTRRLTGDLNASYQISQFDEPGVNRKDNTMALGCGLSWAPLKWLTMNLSYSFIDFNTDSALRQDYQENIGMITIRMTPASPVKFSADKPRTTLEDRLFDF